jgi:hypothetical protein
MTNREAFRTPAASIARLSRVQGTMRRVGSLGISRLFVALLLTAGMCEVRLASADEAPCGRCVVVVASPAHADRLPPRLSGVEILVRVRPGGEAAGRQMVEAVVERGGRAGLLIEGLPRRALPPALASALETVVIRIDDALVVPVELHYDLKTRLTALRASLPRHVPIGIAAPDAMLGDLLAHDIGAYADFVVGRSPPSVLVPWWFDAGELSEVATAVRGTHSGAPARSLWQAPRDGEVLTRMLADLAAAAAILPEGLVLVHGASVRVACGERQSDVWLDPETLDHVSWIDDCQTNLLRVTPADRAAEVVALSTGDLLVSIRESTGERFAEGIDVRAPRLLTVQEVIARHQAAVARQASRVRTRISTGTLTLTFEAPGFPAPVTIGSDAIIYSDRTRTEIEQRSIRVNGLAFGDRGVPRLPLIEPERVVSAPLAIELTDMYAYTLAGTETVNGTPCYVVSFEPLGERSLFKGKAWIAADSFALVKLAATQVRLRGPIVYSEQVDRFEQFDEQIWLLRESRVHQVYQGAAHRTPIERVLALHRHEINAADFTDRRAGAYASGHVMLRDTADGYRYLARRSGVEGAAGEAIPPNIHGPAERVRTIAVGMIVDPNITRPLPFAGVNYVDFNLFGTGMQFNGFFGGTFGQLAFSLPSAGGSRWQLAGRAFAIASSFNDRAFLEGREQYERNIRQRPAHLSVQGVRPLSERVSLGVGYDLDYTHYAPAESTDPAFVVPASHLVHGVRVVVEARKRGWNASAWWAPAVRQAWRDWGGPGSDEYRSEHRDFQRYGASLARSIVLTPALVARGEAAWMGGHDLDRFSRYSFGAFDNPLRGYPSALIRYDRGAVLRGAMAWSASSRLRLDGFADAAFVHDPGFGEGLHRFTGIGMAVEAPAPFGTLLSAEWGFGVQGRRNDGHRGTHVFRVTAYKIF